MHTHKNTSIYIFPKRLEGEFRNIRMLKINLVYVILYTIKLAPLP